MGSCIERRKLCFNQREDRLNVGPLGFPCEMNRHRGPLVARTDPDLGGAMILPIGKEADTVSAGKNIVEVMFELREREILINHLGHLESRLHLEGDLCNHTKGSKSDHGAWKFDS